MSVMNGMNISSSGMSAQRLRMDIISQNIANVNTTRDENGDSYKRQMVVFAEKNVHTFDNVLKTAQGGTTVSNGVKVTQIIADDKTPMKMVYDPSHPDADDEGYVSYPNVNTVTEMTDLIDASRSFEANVTAFNATKNMALKSLELGK